MEIEPDDPAMALLSKYISEEVDKRVNEAMDLKVESFQSTLSRMQQEIDDMFQKIKLKVTKDDLSKVNSQILELQQCLEKIQVSRQRDEEVSSDAGAASGSDVSDNDASSDNDMDLEVLEEKTWGKSYGEAKANKQKKQKEVNSDDENPKKKKKESEKAEQIKRKRGRPLGSKNRISMKDMKTQFAALKQQLEKYQKK